MNLSKKPKGRGFLSFWQGKNDKTGQGATLLESVFNALSDPAFLLDASDRIQKMNTPGRLLVRDTPDDRSLPARLGSSELLLLLQRSRQPSGKEDAGTPPEEIHLRRAPAADIWLEGSATPLPVDAGLGEGRLFVVLRDISKRRHLETLRRDFVANVSHDLRTPVTILKGYTETLHEDYEKLNDAEKQRFIDRIHRNVGRLHRLLEDMLQLAVLEQGNAQLNTRTGAVHTVLNEAIDLFADRFAGAGVGMEVSFEANDRDIPVDPQKFLRAMLNLLENTLHHAAGMTRIQIKTTPAAQGGLVVSVIDDGTGVVQADMERMFERFFRADKSRTGEKSLGLGLSIVKHIIRLHGGNITATPNRPRGLCIHLELPAAPAPTAASV